MPKNHPRNPHRVSAHAKAAVARSIASVGQMDLSADLSGKTFYIIADGVGVCDGIQNIPPNYHRFSFQMPDYSNARHLVLALRGETAKALLLLVDILHGTKTHGPVFLFAHSADLGLMLHVIYDMVELQARLDRNRRDV